MSFRRHENDENIGNSLEESPYQPPEVQSPYQPPEDRPPSLSDVGSISAEPHTTNSQQPHVSEPTQDQMTYQIEHPVQQHPVTPYSLHTPTSSPSNFHSQPSYYPTLPYSHNTEFPRYQHQHLSNATIIHSSTCGATARHTNSDS